MSNVYGLAYNYVGFQPFHGVLPFWKAVVSGDLYDNRIRRYIADGHFINRYSMWAEVEIAALIGKSVIDGSTYVAAITVANDVTRGLVSEEVHGIKGKGGEGMCKLAKVWYKTTDVDYESGRIGMAINGERVQHNHLKNMKLRPNDAKEWLEKIIDLEQGDIILLGTPPHNKDPIKTGDTVECWVEGLGTALKSYVV